MSDQKKNSGPCGTKGRILAAGEKLFARDGFHGASLRAITSEAGANIGAVNYHFGSKEAFLEAIFLRRLVPLNEKRADLLEAERNSAISSGRPLSVEKILRGFIAPTLELKGSPGGKDFATLVGRTLSEPDEQARGIFLRLIGPILNLYLGALCEALPNFSKNLVYWHFRFALGSMSHIMSSPENPALLPEGVEPVGDHEKMTDILVSFVSKGMEAP